MNGIPKPPAESDRLFVIRRTPVGIILVYLEAVAAIAALFLVAVLISPEIFNGRSFSNLAWGSLAMLVVGLGVFFMLLVATYIYNQNRIIVTGHDVKQIIQRGLLFRSISRLELSDVEDVAVDQNGLLPTLFDFGTLTIETAGAQQDNFVFPYCAHPNIYAHRLLHARGKYIEATAGKVTHNED